MLTHTHTFVRLLPAVALAGMLASSCTQQGTPDAGKEECTQGMLGCGCIGGSACWPGSGWLCVDGKCQEPTCAEGELGCTCYSNNTCNNGSNGEPLLCMGGTCQTAPCSPGSIGCDCLTGGLCNDGLACTSLGSKLGCSPINCTAGTEGCPCGSARACNGGLVCAQTTCIVPTCRPGALDCWCKTDLGCDSGLQCNEEGRCEEIPCTPGSNGCQCNQGACTSPTSYCDAQNICQTANCVTGAEGCPCGTGASACGTADDGTTRLFCENSICRRDSCAPGSLTCACENGASCDPGGVCHDGTCVRQGCSAGEASCTCAGHACNSGLRCREDNVCVDATGYAGGPCTTNHACNRGARCDTDICVRCTLGTPGCACLDDSSCYSGAVCLAGTCVAEADVPPVLPDNIECFTPCTADLVTTDGGLRNCKPDGLMAGCVGGRECRQGSCLLPTEAVPTCTSPSQCPAWQTCIGGHCYSECDVDSECPAGKGCSNHVCRVRCNGTTQVCATGQHCLSSDGTNGFCVLDTPRDAVSITEVIGDFSLNRTAVEMTNVAVTGSFQITNNSPLPQTFVIRKSSHSLQLADGSGTTAVRAADGKTLCDGGSCPSTCSSNAQCTSGYQCVSNLCRPASCTQDTCPMFWLELGPLDGTTMRGEEISVDIEAGASRTVKISKADQVTGVRWSGVLEVINDKLGKQRVNLAYNQIPEGQWGGEMVYLSTFGTRELDAWRVSQTTRDDGTLQERVGNALIGRWGAFRSGRISWDEMQAVFTATESGSWNYNNVKTACAGVGEVCYLYNQNRAGVGSYTSSSNSIPVPSGVVTLPFAVNLRFPDASGNPKRMTGRIESDKALQYAGTPAITLNFAANPQQCQRTALGACMTFLDSMDADVLVGGRYLTTSTDTTCSKRANASFALHTEPWLVPGFKTHTSTDATTGITYRSECRDTLLPFQSSNPAIQAEFARENVSLAVSNPIPDARARRRHLSLIDGAMINQSQLVILFEEKFGSFLGSDDTTGFSAYGYMILRRRTTDLDTTDANGNAIADVYEGATATDSRTEPTNVLAPSCSTEILTKVLGSGVALSTSNVAQVVNTVLDGVKSGTSVKLTSASVEQPHYLCEDTGMFDGGKLNVTPHGKATISNGNTCTVTGRVNNTVCDDGGPFSQTSLCPLGSDLADCGTREDDDADQRVLCPAGSKVTWFTVDSTLKSQVALAADSCNDTGTCRARLNEWLEASNPVINPAPVYTCTNTAQAYCDSNRYDLTDGKTFYAASDQTAVYTPLPMLIDDAFRYETRFRSRSGGTVGFAPRICVPNSNSIPYCYDPDQIEDIQDRVDCLLNIWNTDTLYSALDTNNLTVRQKLDAYLKKDFATTQVTLQGNAIPTTFDGFERQFARLMIMLGDDVYTKAFASRFDLAQTASLSFDGDLFESNGIRLSGAAGYEMYTLYMAVQYYQMVVDRFYSHSPLIWKATTYSTADRNFVSPATVISYMDRVIRASTQKARAWGEIAKRYNRLNRADLARQVSQRAYTATYLESIIINRMMLQIVDASAPQDRLQINASAVEAQNRYRAALLDMQDVHTSIKDEITFFGLAPDYIPFPALDNADFRQSNAFEASVTRVQSLMQQAREREDLALNSNREFETDSAQFQSELTQIRQNYENQLADLCGTFIASDGTVYPAVSKYAYLDPVATLVGQPCGFLGNGQIHDGMAAFEEIELDARALQVNYANTLAEVDIEIERVSGQCHEILQAADYVYEQQGVILGLNTGIKTSELIVNRLRTVQNVAGTTAGLAANATTDPTSVTAVAGAVSTYTSTVIATEIGITTLEALQSAAELGIEQINRATARWQTENECDLAKVESSARVKTILLRLKELDVEALKLEQRMRIALGDLGRLRNTARRLEQEQAETESMAINVAAARNDPNIRIYKNDAIINADLSFNNAIRNLYKLTRVYEYYTSQSYAHKGDLYLIRMVARGDKNLENYFTELQNAFTEFEEEFGNPAVRVHIMSLKNDILHIPYTDENGKAYTDTQRTQLMRAKLTDVNNLDKNGYISLPFNTRLDNISPLTRNHKLLQVEADIFGNDTGDYVGRVYLRLKGTSTIHTLDDSKVYYRFDPRTAVINTIFGGVRYFDSAVYQNYRLRDRPFVNTNWELVLNQRDEQVNQDINLASLTDIRLHLYYSDFTTF